MPRIFLLILLSILLLSCADTEETPTTTFLGGEIINPKWEHVLLAKNDKITDTLFLDSRNRFKHEFKDLEPGLYNIIHGERQLVHLEQGDSIMFRVNTIEFDESLSFSGRGSERSNFLANMYLHWEKENVGFTRHYQKNPINFQRLLDSMLVVRTKILDKFYSKYETSEAFEEIAIATTYLDNYQRKESYPFSHYGKNKMKFIEELPKGFYRFRESVNINNTNLTELYAYQRYLNAFIDNQAFMQYGDKKPYNTLSFDHNYNEIKVIDKYITNTDLKDQKLLRIARIFLANSNDKKGVDQIFADIHQKISCEDVQAKVNQLYTDHKKMEAGNTIPDLMLIDPEQKRMVTLSSRITRPTVLYFWSYNNLMHMENSHKKVEELASKYPEFSFIGININAESDMWLRHLQKHTFNPHNEYRFENTGEARRKLVINDLSKTIVLNANGKILNSHANLHRATFENDLLTYLNQ